MKPPTPITDELQDAAPVGIEVEEVVWVPFPFTHMMVSPTTADAIFGTNASTGELLAVITTMVALANLGPEAKTDKSKRKKDKILVVEFIV